MSINTYNRVLKLLIKIAIFLLFVSLSLGMDILFQNYKEIKLKNNMKVVFRRDHSIPIVAIQLWIKVGSIDENELNNGISHFVEHMVFKGTEKYKIGEIAKLIESYGGTINASTSREFTNYYINIPSEGVIDALDVIYEMAFNATFPEEAVELERLVVLEEVKRAEDYIETALFDNFNELLFTETPYKFRVIGTTTAVSRISRDELFTFYKTYYVPNNMTLVIVGDVKFGTIKNAIRKFEQIKPGSVPERKNLIEPGKEQQIKTENKLTDNTRILCGFIGPDLNSQDIFPADVVATILGGGRSSRLYRKLREEKKLVYGISASFLTQVGSGIFYISAICPQDKSDIVKEEIINEVNNLLTDTISDTELNRAKEMIVSADIFAHETFHGQATTLGYWSSFDRVKTLKKYIREIKRVKKEDIRKFLRRYYKGMVFSIINPKVD